MPDNPQLALFSQWLQSVDSRLDTLERGAHPQPGAADPVDAVTAAAAGAAAAVTATPPLDEADLSAADVRAAYRLLLDREPDAAGLARYGAGAVGLTRGELVAELLGSEERARLCASRIVPVEFGDFTISVDRTERDFGRTLAKDHVWETHILHHIAALLSPGDVFVDIGANVGIMSFHAATIVGPTGKVIAFEPNPDNVARFLEGLMLNGFRNIRVYPLAVSAENSVFALQGSSNTALASPSIGARLIASVTADSLLQTEPRIDLIKIDVEGHEPRVFEGLLQTLQRHAPAIICEFNPRCLRGAGHTATQDLAVMLFERAVTIEVIEHDTSLTAVATAADLMALWAQRNAEHIVKGDLPAGMVHFDLLIRYRRQEDDHDPSAGSLRLSEDRA